ncbi:hypothetical protein [Leucobacter chromiireducens]|uniref:hypothetical protein n=1 Tax=Leucobacter chromiireducens TaxID=283877 RepID=UPI003F7E0711
MEVDYGALNGLARGLRAAASIIVAEGGVVPAFESGSLRVEREAHDATAERARVVTHLAQLARDQAQLCEEMVQSFQLLDAQVAWATERFDP